MLVRFNPKTDLRMHSVVKYDLRLSRANITFQNSLYELLYLSSTISIHFFTLACPCSRNYVLLFFRFLLLALTQVWSQMHSFYLYFLIFNDGPIIITANKGYGIAPSWHT
ncbi:Uncharacterized protein TCM_038136 [Theobroma cacao]|uniref:Uncharacterized protein n=1 Tax=Theobroma cacao TaxID=3641 RepID=A0A061GVK3_THECC|nr:Uncharacterized protein TCM_038136 [Theobroma cacao]